MNIKNIIIIFSQLIAFVFILKYKQGCHLYTFGNVYTAQNVLLTVTIAKNNNGRASITSKESCLTSIVPNICIFR